MAGLRYTNGDLARPLKLLASNRLNGRRRHEIHERVLQFSPVCSPAPVALITGRYQHRLRGGWDEPMARGGPDLGLPPEHPTMPSLLRDAGYSTALIGKWHLGSPAWYSPEKSGYQEYFGFPWRSLWGDYAISLVHSRVETTNFPRFDFPKVPE